MTLWDKGQSVDALVHRFTVGDDPVLDARLVGYDCRASATHARMLESIGVLSQQELDTLLAGLREILELDAQGKFTIRLDQEDCHTAIEEFLTIRYGDVGKKIHTGRSRNDQVLTALRMYQKDAVREVRTRLAELTSSLERLIAASGDIPLPGYTHTRKAMPSSVSMWAGSFVAAALDDDILLDSVGRVLDQSPLGSAAGFGVVGLPINREMTAQELGFAKVQSNPMYAQLSRGKFELALLAALGQVMLTLNRLASDLILFTSSEFGFATLSSEFTTGSSIMPQKHNPDPLELVRGSYHMVVGEEAKLKGLTANLLSGYHRDFQLGKGPLMNGVDITLGCLGVMPSLIA